MKELFNLIKNSKFIKNKKGIELTMRYVVIMVIIAAILVVSVIALIKMKGQAGGLLSKIFGLGF